VIAQLVAAFLAAAQTSAPDLYMSVRTLQRLQDAAVMGDADAQNVRVKLLARIADDWSTGKPHLDRRNAQAAIVYLLSGGEPELGEKFLSAGEIEPELKRILEGAAAYANDDKAKAAELLIPLDLARVPRDLGGQIALVRASLRKAGENDAMLADLRLARALMPGTMIEEAALRRAAALAAETRNLDEFEYAAGRYFRRFSRSLYAGQFAAAFAGFVETFGYHAMPDRFEKLAGVIEGLAPEKSAHVLLEIAREAVLYGRGPLARFATERVLHDAAPGSEVHTRASLYLGAVLVAGDEEHFAEGKAALAAVDRGKLIAADNELLNRALAMAEQVVAEPPTAADASPPSGREPAEADSFAGTAERAVKAMQETDTALKEAVWP
jgi:chemotaxis protein MotC